MSDQVLNPRGAVHMPAMEIPTFRTSLAIQRGTERRLLFRVWGGLGDQICAEPTMRWALDKFKDNVEISLAAENPELFRHLPFKDVFHIPKYNPDWDSYFVFQTIQPPASLQWEFVCHMIVNCIDFVSLACFRCQLPNDVKNVILEPQHDDIKFVRGLIVDSALEEVGSDARAWVAVHAGKHWPSKTFPKDWWDDVLQGLRAAGITPVLIGGDSDENRGTVDVDTDGCLDLRNRLSVMQSVALLKHATCLLTNDSSPLHMTAAGEAHIGFIATCKHPDYITHWRGPNKEFGWRMKNLGRGGYWEHMDYLPNKAEDVTVEHVDEVLLRTWLPEPKVMVRYALESLVGETDAARLMPEVAYEPSATIQ